MRRVVRRKPNGNDKCCANGVKHYIDTSGLAYSFNEFYTQNMPDKVAWKTLQSDLFANLPQIKKAERMPQDFFRSFAEVVEKTSGMGCRAYKTPALSRRRKVAYHAGKKEPLMGLAAAAARCLVGGTGGGLPLAAGHEDNGSVGCAEQRAGREAVCVGVEQDSPRFFVGVYGGLCGSGYCGRDGSEEHPPR